MGWRSLWGGRRQDDAGDLLGAGGDDGLKLIADTDPVGVDGQVPRFRHLYGLDQACPDDGLQGVVNFWVAIGGPKPIFVVPRSAQVVRFIPRRSRIVLENLEIVPPP